MNSVRFLPSWRLSAPLSFLVRARGVLSFLPARNSMADLKVNITTTADLSGTQAAEQALQNVTAAAGQLVQASETASVAQSKASDAIDKSAVEADKLTGSFKETLPQAQKVADALK